MKRNPQVVAFMTPFPYSIDVDAPLAEAHALMRKHHFRHLPVTSAQAIVGILTDRDIKLVLGPDFGSPNERELRVRDAYVERPCVVPASTPVGSSPERWQSTASARRSSPSTTSSLEFSL
jgi:acetoin utilization protein AcuB